MGRPEALGPYVDHQQGALLLASFSALPSVFCGVDACSIRPQAISDGIFWAVGRNLEAVADNRPTDRICTWSQGGGAYSRAGGRRRQADHLLSEIG